MSEENPQYGPHEFSQWRHDDDVTSCYCSCGAHHLAVGQNGSFFPASNPLPDPDQCRLNPIYGPHYFLIAINADNGTVTKAECRCGAQISQDNDGKFIIKPESNPLVDPELCRLNHLSKKSDLPTDETTSSQYWYKQCREKQDELQRLEAINSALQNKLKFVSKSDEEKYKLHQMMCKKLRAEEAQREEVCKAIKAQMNILLVVDEEDTLD